jgi:hypothetical protein
MVYGMLLISFYLFGMRALTSLPLELRFEWGGGGGCLGVRELLGAANHLIALLQLLVDGDHQIQAPVIPIIAR